jgi:hypothetical protein
MDVLEAYDVVLAQVAAGLHLDQLEIDLDGIGQPVTGADRQVDRSVLVHEVFIAWISAPHAPSSDRDLRHSSRAMGNGRL